MAKKTISTTKPPDKRLQLTKNLSVQTKFTHNPRLGAPWHHHLGMFPFNHNAF
jgi:hypothetical protein